MALSKDPSGPLIARENANTWTYVAHNIHSIVKPIPKDKNMTKKLSKAIWFLINC
jgi:hypothetical protein